MFHIFLANGSSFIFFYENLLKTNTPFPIIASQFKVFAGLISQHSLRSAVGLNTLKPQKRLLCIFSLLCRN